MKFGKKHLLILTIFLFSVSGLASAANYCVRDGASGSNNGSDWTNAYTDLPSTLSRGSTYYIADGTYSGYTFDDSGTTLTYIKKAIASDHGTSTGWSSGYGDGLATFGSITFTTSYWVIDGQTGGGPGSWESGFGIKLDASGSRVVLLDSNASNITLAHLDMEHNGRDTHNSSENIIYAITNSENVTISYCYLHDVAVCHLLTRGTDGFILEYSKFARNGSGGDSIHREAWSASVDDNVIIRYCIFEDISNTGILCLVNGTGNAENWQIYGNVFCRTPSDPSVVSGWVVVKYASPTFISAVNWKVYNNAIVNLKGLGAGLSIGGGSGNVAKNNIFYNNNVNIIQFNNISHDYNWFEDNLRTDGCSPPCDLDPGNAASETNGIHGSADPFVDWENGDFDLTSGTDARDNGTDLGTSYDEDAYGNTRGADGDWDIGAYEYVSGAPDTTAPSPDPMTWSTDPYATGDTSISMTATTATDVSGVEYYFDCIAGGGNDSGWQNGTTYEDTGLSASTQYTYQVKARDKSSNQNETAYSTTKSATTNAADTTAPSPDPMTWATEPNATGTSSISMTATTATDTSGVEYYFDETSGNPGGSDSSWQDSATYQDAGLDANTTYTYRVKARDKSSNQNETAYSTTKSATTDAAGDDPNLAAWWKFDETSGTSASDSSGNDHTGTLENGSSFTSGYINNAVNFDGSDDRVSCGTWNVTGSALTICCWFKADSWYGSSYDARIVSKATGTAEADHTWMLSPIKEGSSNKRLRFRLKTGGTTSTLIASSGNMTTGTWYHGAAVYNGSTMKLYLDANEVGSTSKSGSITTSSYGIAVGNQPSGAGDRPWDGLIDDVRIYDSALSESELEELISGEDTTAPSPDPMTWATEPYSTGTTSISMTATTATDASGVEYYFDCTAGGGNDSGWQDSATYEDTGLSASTQYSYQVKARDKSSNQNDTTYSTLKSATTDATPDTTPPSPDPMTWSTEPYATGTTSISMTATTATDASGVEYYFECTAGGGHSSSWQDSTTYEDTGLSASTQYTYRVKARDKSSNQNETGYSTTKSATTDTPSDTTPPSPDPMTWATEPYATGSTSISMTATTATDTSGVEYYFDCTAGGGNDSGWQDSTTYEDTGLSELTEYTYRVKARDKSSNQNETAYSTTRSATTQDGTAPGPDPMTWATDPYSTGTTSISMTATTATDTSGVEYSFDCTAGGGNDSGWQDSATYEDTGLSSSTQYTYQVQSRDKSSNQNATGWSTEKSATTDSEAGPNLVSWWKLDESSGTNADDSSGNNHDGTLSGGSWAPTSGKFDGAVDLGDNNTDYVQVPTTGMSASAGTVSVWGRIEGTQSGSRYFFGHTSGDWEDSIQLYMDNSDNNLDLGFGGVHPKHANIMTLSANTWYHIALTWDGTNYVVYVDGIEEASGTYTGLSTLNSIADIGNDGNTGYRIEAFQGLLDDVCIYDGALSKNDIADLAGITIASNPSPADEATGVSTTADLSWSAGYYAADVNGHDVYFGTDYNSVADANHSSSEFKGTQSSTTYDPGTLTASTTYYWAIDEINDTNVWPGYVWSFTTILPDINAPSPDPMTWATEPNATGTSSISMTGTTATDISGVEYYFECTAGGGNDSGWQDSTTYEDTGLDDLTQYTYRVKARDKSAAQNETGYSTSKSATTQDGTAPSPDPMTWATEPNATGSTSISMTATTATDASGVEYYFDCTAGGGNDSGWQDSATYEDTALSPETQYTYKVQARDKSTNQNATGWSTEKSTTTESGADPNLTGWWKLDESSGTTAADSSGNDYDGTRSGGSWAPTGGKFDGAVELGTDTNDHVEVPATGMSASAGTVSVWGRMEGTQSGCRYFFGHTYNPPGWTSTIQLYMDGGNNQLDLGLGDTHAKDTNIMTLSVDTWYHIALTWDGGDYVVYVDGIEEASGTYTGLSNIGSIADIGNNGNYSDPEAFQGKLDDVRIYDSALSQSDVNDLADE